MTAIAIDDHVVWTLAKLSFDKLEQMLKGRGGGNTMSVVQLEENK